MDSKGIIQNFVLKRLLEKIETKFILISTFVRNFCKYYCTTICIQDEIKA
jgi:hypothetical protein